MTQRSLYFIVSIGFILSVMPGCFNARQQENEQITSQSPMKVLIIVGSVRDTKMGCKIAAVVKEMIAENPAIESQIVEVGSYHLPFYTDEMPPINRAQAITDPVLKEWSDIVQAADGFIIVSPEYNYGYPAPLKNALDSLYKEWNNKPVALIGYSGGPSGGALMLAQLRQVASALKLITVETDIKIPQSWKAFDQDGKFVEAEHISTQLGLVVDQLLAARGKN